MFFMKKFNLIYNVMKKVSFKFLMAAFAAVLALGFTSCSSDDYVEEKTVDVDLDIDSATRALRNCAGAFQWLQDNGYKATGKTFQIPCNFNKKEGDVKIWILTTDAEGQNKVTATGTEKFFYYGSDAMSVIDDVLNVEAKGYTAKWKTGSITGYEFKKKTTGELVYLWVGVHVVATNGIINTEHSGGEMF